MAQVMQLCTNAVDSGKTSSYHEWSCRFGAFMLQIYTQLLQKQFYRLFAQGFLSSFCLCQQVHEKVNLSEKSFILVHGF